MGRGPGSSGAMSRAVALIESDSPAADRVVSVRGEIDVGSTPALRDWIGRASDGGRCSVAVDLSHVEFMAVSGLYVLCDEQARLAKQRSRLSVVGAGPRVVQLFEVCRLTDVLRLVASRSALGPAGWTAEDDARTQRLEAWMSRYAAAGRASSPA